MSALAEALVAAQRRALSVLEKAYVAGAFEDDRMREQLDAMGCADGVDQDYLIQSLDVIRAYGGPLPAAPRADNGVEKPPEKASERQVSLIQKMLRERALTPLAEQDLRNLSKQRASTLIDSLTNGTYNAAEWDVAF